MTRAEDGPPRAPEPYRVVPRPDRRGPDPADYPGGRVPRDPFETAVGLFLGVAVSAALVVAFLATWKGRP